MARVTDRRSFLRSLIATPVALPAIVLAKQTATVPREELNWEQCLQIARELRSDPRYSRTYGEIIAIYRQSLVNDDLKAFSRLPRMPV